MEASLKVCHEVLQLITKIISIGCLVGQFYGNFIQVTQLVLQLVTKTNYLEQLAWEGECFHEGLVVGSQLVA